jgi:site-specific recombinase XerD
MSDISQLHYRFCQHSLVFKGNTPRTIKWFESDFRWFQRFANLETIEQLTKSIIEDWIRHGKLEKGWSPKTIRLRLQSLSLFLNWCVQEEIIAENPCLRIPKPKIPKTIPKHLSLEKAQELLEWTRNYPFDYKFDRKRAIAIIATFLYTGIRKAELENLKMEDVDIENKTLYVRQGKCSKDRLIPLNTVLIEYMSQYLKDRKRMKKNCPYFFTSMRQDSKMGESVIKRLFDKIKKASKIDFYPHLLRHTFATLMLEGGCNLFALSQMMGHSDIKTTTIYLAATKSHLLDQIAKHPLDT